MRRLLRRMFRPVLEFLILGLSRARRPLIGIWVDWERVDRAEPEHHGAEPDGVFAGPSSGAFAEGTVVRVVCEDDHCTAPEHRGAWVVHMAAVTPLPGTPVVYCLHRAGGDATPLWRPAAAVVRVRSDA